MPGSVSGSKVGATLGLDQLVAQQVLLGLEVGLAERFRAWEGGALNAATGDLDAQRSHVERVGIEGDASAAERLHRQAHVRVALAAVARGAWIDRVVAGLLAAKVEPEQVPHLH